MAGRMLTIGKRSWIAFRGALGPRQQHRHIHTGNSNSRAALGHASTIFAVSTPPGRGALAVVRISGPDAASSLQHMGRQASGWTPSVRAPTLQKLYDDASNLLDISLYVYFPAPRSFTGEDVVELHLHGSPAVVKGAVTALNKIDNLRLAEPGEFSKRAVLNGKMDLLEAEGVADLIDAATEQQRKQALTHMDGSNHVVFSAWTDEIKQCLAHVEAYIDFAEDDESSHDMERLRGRVDRVLYDVSKHLSDGRHGELVREGLPVTLFGPPNSGKSSLFNLLVRRSAAIVSDQPGTTRDVIEIKVDIGGNAVILCDTAGIRETSDVVEQQGIIRTIERLRHSPLQMCVLSMETFQFDLEECRSHITPETVVVLNKSDRMGEIDVAIIDKAFESFQLRTPPQLLSCTTESGLENVVAELTKAVSERLHSADTNTSVVTRERHRLLLEECASHLTECIVHLDSDDGLDFASEHLRLSLRCIGKVTGAVHVEEVLDVVFKDFCIGK